MEDWDSPKRSRLFLAAALLTAACGFMLTNDRLDAPKLVENGLGAGAAVSDAAPAAAPPAAPMTEQAPVAAAPTGVDDPGRENLRDAVAALPSMSPADAAARTAAFAAPAGRVAGAFAPVAAPDRWAARRSARPATDGPSSSAVSLSSAAPSFEPSRRPPRAADAVAPRGRVSAGGASGRDGARGKTLSPAERLFSAPELGLGEVSARGSATAGTAASARAPAAARRPAAPRASMHGAGLARLLGKGALRAPLGVKRPAGDPWARPIPAAGPDGAPLSAKPLGMAAAESATPPPACARKGMHWDSADGVQWLHDGALRGRLEGGRWAWVERDAGRWWLWPAPAAKPLVESQDHWWLQSRGMWFLLHDGEPWGYQYLKRWGTEGFAARSGDQMIYSADGTRLGVIVPGEGAILYDARTGRELGRWPDERLPSRRAPAAQAPSF